MKHAKPLNVRSRALAVTASVGLACIVVVALFAPRMMSAAMDSAASGETRWVEQAASGLPVSDVASGDSESSVVLDRLSLFRELQGGRSVDVVLSEGGSSSYMEVKAAAGDALGAFVDDAGIDLQSLDWSISPMLFTYWLDSQKQGIFWECSLSGETNVYVESGAAGGDAEGDAAGAAGGDASDAAGGAVGTEAEGASVEEPLFLNAMIWIDDLTCKPVALSIYRSDQYGAEAEGGLAFDEKTEGSVVYGEEPSIKTAISEESSASNGLLSKINKFCRETYLASRVVLTEMDEVQWLVEIQCDSASGGEGDSAAVFAYSGDGVFVFNSA